MSNILLVVSHSNGSLADASRYLGWWPIGLKETGKSLILTTILLSASLYKYFVMDHNLATPTFRYQEAVRGQEWGMAEHRTFVSNFEIFVQSFDDGSTNICSFQGTLTKDLLFISSTVPLLIQSKLSSLGIIFLVPVTSILVDIHNFYALRLSHPDHQTTALARGYLLNLLFIHLRTGSFLAMFSTHAFCTWSRRLLQSSPQDGSAILDLAREQKSRVGNAEEDLSRRALKSRVLYYLCLSLSAWGFYWGLWALTESPAALRDF
jgi:prenyl protein peptidase